MTTDPKILPYYNKLKNDALLATKSIREFLTTERTNPLNNSSRKSCIRELQVLVEKKPTNPIRDTLLYYSLQQDLNRSIRFQRDDYDPRL